MKLTCCFYFPTFRGEAGEGGRVLTLPPPPPIVLWEYPVNLLAEGHVSVEQIGERR